MHLFHYPPVYTPIGASAFASAFAALFWRNTVTTVLSEAQNSANAQLQKMLPNRAFVFTNSGTSALALALNAVAAHGRNSGKPRVVALPAYCCPDVGTAAIAAGYSIRLYDTDSLTLMPNWGSVRECLANGASALVVAHLFGRIVDVSYAESIASEFGAVVVEDAAQGAGGTLRDVSAGALGDFSILSFGRGKGFNAGGGGVFTRSLDTQDVLQNKPQNKAQDKAQDEAQDEAQNKAQSEAQDKAQSEAVEIEAGELPQPSFTTQAVTLAKALVGSCLSRPWIYSLPASLPFLKLGETVYHDPTPPMSSGALLNSLIASALKHGMHHVELRQKVESWYEDQLQNCTSILVKQGYESVHEMQSGALRFPVRLSHEVGLSLARLGVARAYPRTLTAYPEIAQAIIGDYSSTPGANELAESLYTLPTHNLLRIADRKKIVETLQRHYATASLR